jgi:hypothetical protein
MSFIFHNYRQKRLNDFFLFWLQGYVHQPLCSTREREIRRKPPPPPNCIKTSELVAEIHTCVAIAAWRERKQTRLYDILLTKILFATGVSLFFLACYYRVRGRK